MCHVSFQSRETYFIENGISLIGIKLIKIKKGRLFAHCQNVEYKTTLVNDEIVISGCSGQPSVTTQPIVKFLV